MSKVVHLSENLFESTIRENTGKVIIDFWAPWCGPCRSLGKILDEISIECEDIKIFKVNVDECSSLLEDFEISSIPVMLFFHGGKLIDQTVGTMIKRDIIAKFLKKLDSSSFF
ncbi:MAG: thiol reductase thioredoxin [Puniceicoccales bacterium]|jgi:thioredoxin 1|nr:thiol reductase thioredoxin [Puniceicoccales bacterium]